MLEVGCSNGRWLEYLGNRLKCKELQGVDESARGFRKNTRIEFTRWNALRLREIWDESFDFVFSFGLIEHFKKDDRFHIIKEQDYTLRSGGYLACELPTLSLSLSLMQLKLYNEPILKRPFHYRVTRKELLEHFKNLGLEVVYDNFIGWYPEHFGIPKLFNSSFLSDNYLIIGKKH